MKLADMLVDQQPVSARASLREGHDFHTQQQLQRLRPATSTVYRVQPLVARLAAAILHELQMFEWTGQLPGGVPWSEHPAWRVELWEAFWEAQSAAAG